GVNIWITDAGIWYDFYKSEMIDPDADKYSRPPKFRREGVVIKMEIAHEGKSRFQSEGEPIFRRNYIKGNIPDRRTSSLGCYKEIELRDTESKVAVNLGFDNGIPRYNFKLRENADPDIIKIRFSGQDALDVNLRGELIFKTPFGDIVSNGLKAFKYGDEDLHPIDCRFTREGDIIKFKLDRNYDGLKRIIDPLIFSTFAGGEEADQINAIDINSDGELIAAGWTESPDMPTTTGAYSEVISGGRDVWIGKYKIEGNRKELLWASFIGGDGDDVANGCAFDDEGNIYIAGNTQSTNFPVESPMIPELGGKTDCFVLKLDPEGRELEFSTYLGSTQDDFCYAIDVGQSKAIYLTGGTYSTDFPTQSPVDGDHNGLEDMFITKLAPSGSSIVFSTYMGTYGNEHGTAIEVDEGMNTILLGAETDNSRFPTKPNRFPYRGYDRHFNGGWDAVIIRYFQNGGEYDFSMFYGGPGDDRINDVAIIGADLYMFTGQTKSDLSAVSPESEDSEFNVTNNAYDQSHNGGWDGFIAYIRKVEILQYSSYIGGSADDIFYSLSYNPTVGLATAVGFSKSNDFPVIGDPTNPRVRGGSSVAIVQFSPQNSEIVYSSVLGGNGADVGAGTAVDDLGDIYIGGYTTSAQFPTEEPTQAAYGGVMDGFVLKKSFNDFTITSPTGGAEVCQGKTMNLTWATNKMPATAEYDLYYYRESDPDLHLIESGIADDEYDWALPVNFPAGDDYIIRVTHNSGIFSEINNVKVRARPRLTEFSHTPEMLFICEGGSAEFSVIATGDDLSYQWTHDSRPVGENSATLTLENLDLSDEGFYAVLISNNCVNGAVADSARLVVLPTTAVMQNPENKTVIEGDDVEFFIVAVGENLSYQWKKNGGLLTGQRESTLMIENCTDDDEGLYSCEIQGRCGSAETTEARLEVEPNSVSDGRIEGIEKLDILVSAAGGGYSMFVLAEISGELIYTISDATGKILMSEKSAVISTGRSIIPLQINELPSGVYYLRGNLNGEITVSKFTVVR
ncbi:MAG: SBBP repeat-containing protein, partial [Candidatus Kapaibacterium sp.]